MTLLYKHSNTNLKFRMLSETVILVTAQSQLTQTQHLSQQPLVQITKVDIFFDALSSSSDDPTAIKLSRSSFAFFCTFCPWMPTGTSPATASRTINRPFVEGTGAIDFRAASDIMRQCVESFAHNESSPKPIPSTNGSNKVPSRKCKSRP